MLKNTYIEDPGLKAILHPDPNLKQEMTQHFGEPVFGYSPEFRTPLAMMEGWEFRVEPGEYPVARGYVSGHCHHKGSYRLFRDGQVWMSPTAQELESLFPLLEGVWNESYDKVVIGGLGLGIAALNCLEFGVEKVIVLEWCPELIQQYAGFLGDRDYDLWNEALMDGRLEVHQCDLRQPLPADIRAACTGADLLYMDIWPDLGSYEAAPETAMVANQIAPRYVAWWGMELDLACTMHKLGMEPEQVLTPEDWAKVTQELHKLMVMDPYGKLSYERLDSEGLDLYKRFCDVAAWNAASH